MEIFEVMDAVQFHYFYSVQKFFGQALQSKNAKNEIKSKRTNKRTNDINIIVTRLFPVFPFKHTKKAPPKRRFHLQISSNIRQSVRISPSKAAGKKS